MKKIKEYAFTIVCIVGIWILCMVPYFPETPLDHVRLIDKWTHIVMYLGLCSVMWIEYLHKHRGMKSDWTKLITYALICPIIMGGLIELAQAYLTCGHRSGDWLDMLADSIGVVLAFLIWSLATWRKSVRLRDYQK